MQLIIVLWILSTLKINETSMKDQQRLDIF